jgi:hypothetical protein
MSHFAETVDFEENYFVKWQGREATRDTWASVYRNALTSNFPLYLETRYNEWMYNMPSRV